MSKKELVDKLTMYIITKDMLPCMPNDARYIADKLRSAIIHDIHVLFGDKRDIFVNQEIYDVFPFLRFDKYERVVTTDELRKVIERCDRLNHYIKLKILTPKETRMFYDIKKRLIHLLYRYTNVIKEEWKEVRDIDNCSFMCYVIDIEDGHKYIFHQPCGNVMSLYHNTAWMDNDVRKYGHDNGNHVFTCTDEERDVMKKELSRLSIDVMLLKSYLIKEHEQSHKSIQYSTFIKITANKL